MKRYLPMFVIVVMLAGAILSACAAPTPQVVTVKETVVVETGEGRAADGRRRDRKDRREEVVVATAVPPTAVPQAPTEKQMGGTLNVWLPNGWPDKAWPYLTNWESTFAVSPMAEAPVLAEAGRDAGADARRELHRLGRRPRLHRQVPRGRQVARRHALHRGGCALHPLDARASQAAAAGLARAAAMELRMIEQLLGSRVVRREISGGRSGQPRVIFEVSGV